MLVNLEHSFVRRFCKDKDALVAGCASFDVFCQNIEKQAAIRYPILGNESEEVLNLLLGKIDKYKGDCFELFVEAMIRLFPCDKRIIVDPRRPNGDDVIENYHAGPGNREDIGVDGFGVSARNKKPFTVQCKYRKEYQKINGKSVPVELSANNDHLTNFTSSSMLHYGVDPKPDPQTGKCNMVIITSASLLNWHTDKEMFGEMVYVFCRKNIQAMVDKSDTFWESFPASCESSLEQLRNKE
jgi:hypothetical protein